MRNKKIMPLRKRWHFYRCGDLWQPEIKVESGKLKVEMRNPSVRPSVCHLPFQGRQGNV